MSVWVQRKRSVFHCQQLAGGLFVSLYCIDLPSLKCGLHLHDWRNQYFYLVAVYAHVRSCCIVKQGLCGAFTQCLWRGIYRIEANLKLKAHCGTIIPLCIEICTLLSLLSSPSWLSTVACACNHLVSLIRRISMIVWFNTKGMVDWCTFMSSTMVSWIA